MYYALTLLLSHHDCLIAVCQHNPHGRGFGAGWSSPVARQAHNLKVVGSNPTPATKNRIKKLIKPPFRGGIFLSVTYKLPINFDLLKLAE